LVATVIEAFGAPVFFLSSRGSSAISCNGASASVSAATLAAVPRCAGWRAAISAAVASARITATTIPREEIADGKEKESFARSVLLDRFDRVECFTVFACFDIFRNESRWSVRSPLSKYRIDREGFGVFFKGTDILLVASLERRMP
jgi:hypothetical protein